MPPLTAAEQAALEHDYRHGKTRLIRQRSHLVLLASELDSQAAIARGVRGSRATLNRTMEAGPRACGVPRPTWTAPLLARYLTEQTGFATGERTVRRGLADRGWVCRRGPWTVQHKAEEFPD